MRRATKACKHNIIVTDAPTLRLNFAKVHMTDIPVIDELSSARIWQHILYATLSTSVNVNYRLPIKVCYRLYTVRHIRI